MAEELAGYRAFPASLATAPDPVRTDLADAIERSDWSNVSIGNKELLKGAISLLRAAPQPLSNPLGTGMREACAKIASDTGFLARQAVRSAKGPRDRSKALGAEEAAQTIRTAILSLPAEGGAREVKEATMKEQFAKIRHRGVFIERQLQGGGVYRFICHTGISKFLPDLYETQEQAIEAVDAKLDAAPSVTRPLHSTPEAK